MHILRQVQTYYFLNNIHLFRLVVVYQILYTKRHNLFSNKTTVKMKKIRLLICQMNDLKRVNRGLRHTNTQLSYLKNKLIQCQNDIRTFNPYHRTKQSTKQGILFTWMNVSPNISPVKRQELVMMINYHDKIPLSSNDELIVGEAWLSYPVLVHCSTKIRVVFRKNISISGKRPISAIG